MAQFSKIYSSIDGQIERLKLLGMKIQDEDKARRCLQRIGYYRLSAYWYPFREIDRSGKTPVKLDQFIESSNFDEVVDFYVFDKELRILVSDGLERIEIALRAQISDLLGARDPWAHRNRLELDGDFSVQSSRRDPKKSRHEDWLASQDYNFSRSKEDFAKHFKKKYPNDNPPIWIAKEVWDWGLLSHFFSGMRTKDKKSIARSYGALNAPELESWVRVLNDIRNYCAHHSRLWNRGIVSQPVLPASGNFPAFDNIRQDSRARGRIYVGLVIMSLMIRELHPKSRWSNRVEDLVKRAPQNPLINYRTAGFPANWEEFRFF